MEKMYSGKWSPHMLADHCWSLTKGTPVGKYEAKEDKVSCPYGINHSED